MGREPSASGRPLPQAQVLVATAALQDEWRARQDILSPQPMCLAVAGCLLGLPCWIASRRYGGRWSKTMCGYGSEDSLFAFELTYNYGVGSYKRGTDLRHIAIRSIEGTVGSPSAGVEPQFAPFQRANQLDAAARLGVPASRHADGSVTLSSPDGYQFLLVDDTCSGAATGPAAKSAVGSDPVLLVSLWVQNLAAALRFWEESLGMAREPSGEAVPGATSLPNAAWLRFRGDSGPALELVELPSGTAVDRGESFGRLAFATLHSPALIHDRLLEEGRILPEGSDLPPVVSGAFAAGGEVGRASGRALHSPVALSTPGKPDVEVAILQDANGHEVCLVGAAGFSALAAHSPGADFINWTARALLGGDGHSPPSPDPDLAAAHAASSGGVVEDICSERELAAASRGPPPSLSPPRPHQDGGAASAGPVNVIKAYGVWCKHCAKVALKYSLMASGLRARGVQARFYQADVDMVPQLLAMVDGGLSRVPAFLAVRDGRVVASYTGSSERRLARFLCTVAPPGDGAGITLSDGRVIGAVGAESEGSSGAAGSSVAKAKCGLSEEGVGHDAGEGWTTVGSAGARGESPEDG